MTCLFVRVLYPFNQLEDKLKMTTTHTPAVPNFLFITPLPFYLSKHSDKGRCSAVNGSKVTESSFRHNGKSHNLKQTSAGYWEKILEGEHLWSCLTSVFSRRTGGGGGGVWMENNSDTLMEKWCELWFLLYSPGLLYFSEDSNSHQSFPSAPFDAAKLIEKQEGLLRHRRAQSRVSYTAYVPTLGTFK